MQIFVTVDTDRSPGIQLSDVAQLLKDALGAGVSVLPLSNLSTILLTCQGRDMIDEIRAKVKAVSPLIRDVAGEEPLVHVSPWISSPR